MIEAAHGDAIGYWLTARRWAEGLGWEPSNHRMARVALLGPPAALIEALGSHPALYYVWPLLSSALVAPLLYLGGKRLGSREGGFAAALLWAFAPLPFRDSSQLLPDPLMGACVLAAAVALWSSLEAVKRRETWAWGVAAGAALFLAWSSKISLIYFGPAFALLFFATVRLKPRAWIAFGGAFATLLTVEWMVYALVFSEWGGPLGVAARTYGLSGRLRPLSLGQLLLGRFGTLGSGEWAALLAFAVAGAVAWRGRWMPRFWILLPLSYLAFHVLHVKSLVPLVPASVFSARYFAPLWPFAFIVIGFACTRLRHWQRPVLALACIAGFVLAVRSGFKNGDHALARVFQNARFVAQAQSSDIPILLDPRVDRVRAGRWVRRAFSRECCEDMDGKIDRRFWVLGEQRIAETKRALLAPADYFDRQPVLSTSCRFLEFRRGDAAWAEKSCATSAARIVSAAHAYQRGGGQ